MPFTFSGEWIPEKKEYPPIKIFKEKRKGAFVTVIQHIPLEDKELKECVSELKQRLATGGSIKNGCVEIQGDKVDAIRLFLQNKGWKVR